MSARRQFMLKVLSAAATIALIFSGAAHSGDETDAAFENIKELIAAEAYEEALDQADKLLAIEGLPDRDAAAALGQKATANAALGRDEEALAALGSALQLEPNDFWLLMRSCNQNLDSGFLAPARQDCALASRTLRHERKAASSDRKRQYLDYTQARIAIRQGNTARAQAFVSRLKKQADSGALFFGAWHVDRLAAQVLQRQRRFEEAAIVLSEGIRDFEEALVSSNENFQRLAAAVSVEDRSAMWFQFGVLMNYMDDPVEAQKAFETSFNLLPLPDNNNPPTKMLERAGYALCATEIQLQRAEQAINRCKWLANSVTYNTSYIAALGDAYVIAGDLTGALQTYEDALSKDPENGYLELRRDQIKDALDLQ